LLCIVQVGAAMTDNLISYYKLDESSGITLDSQNFYNGTTSSIIYGQSGKFNSAYNFSQSSSSSVSFSTLNLTDEVTYNLWLYQYVAEDRSIFAKNANAGTRNVECYSGSAGFVNCYFGGNACAMVSNTTLPLNAWDMITVKYSKSGGNCSLFQNGVLVANSTYSSSLPSNPNVLKLGTYSGVPAGSITGKIDEFGIWNRSLSVAEILTLYNSGNGLPYNFTDVVPPVITLNYPTVLIDYGRLNGRLQLNYSISESNPNKVWHYYNETLSAPISYVNGVNLENITIVTPTLGSSIKNIAYKAQSGGICTQVIANHHANLSTIASLSSFIDSNNSVWISGDYVSEFVNHSVAVYNSSGKYVIQNYTYIAPYNIYYVGTAHNDIEVFWQTGSGCDGYNVNARQFNNFTFTLYANDTAGNLATLDASWDYKVFENNNSFNATALGSTSQGFMTNITYSNTTYPLINAYLIYNGTNQGPATQVGIGNVIAFTKSVGVPASTGNYTFYWIYDLNGTNVTGDTFYQNITAPTSISFTSSSCAAGLTAAFNFTFYDEQNVTQMNNSVDYNVQYGYAGNISSYAIYGSLTNIPSFNICINGSQPQYYINYGEIQYKASGYVDRRYYLFQNTRATNTTVLIPIYSLASSSASSFLIEAKDNLLNPYVGNYVGLMRWYPSLNTYRLVEMAQTDESGRTVMRTKVEDVDYRVALWQQNGTLIKLNNVTRFACLVQPCTYSFTVFSSDQDYVSVTGIQQSLTFNSTSHKFLFIWNDPSGRTQTMNLTVFRETGLNVGPICESIGTGMIGAIDCDVTGYTGQLRAVVYRSASPAIPIASLIENLDQALSSISKTMSLIIALILSLAGFFIGIFNPVLGILMLIASFIPALYLGSITIYILLGVITMAIVVIHFIRRALGG
jgi:hypothetical protein